MNIKLFALILIASTCVALNVGAIGSNNAGTPTQQQLQDGTGTGNQVQTQQQLQDGTGTGNQVQNQNNNPTDNVENEESIKTKIAQERRSQVANAVQEMLQLADRNGGIGQQVRTIAQEQNANQEQIESSLEKIQNRNIFVKLVVGPNYGKINRAEKILDQNQEKIQTLNQIMGQISNEGDAQILKNQIQILEQVNVQLQEILNDSQQGFSLLGWMFKLFSK